MFPLKALLPIFPPFFNRQCQMLIRCRNCQKAKWADAERKCENAEWAGTSVTTSSTYRGKIPRSSPKINNTSQDTAHVTHGHTDTAATHTPVCTLSQVVLSCVYSDSISRLIAFASFGAAIGSKKEDALTKSNNVAAHD